MIQQVLKFDARARELFSIFTDSERFAAMTGMPAALSSEPGAASSMFGGMIAARMIEVVDGQRIVQAWRPGNWEEGVYSIVRFDFADDGEGATISLDHRGYPEGTGEHLDAGWHQRYWEPLKAYLASH
ncbi:SRPBCC domain-containing protein [Martelella radicis]|uniref:Activator of HSP90 ATPase n=1 Tax=Martelella radicis TaxID=1397476 RepID=A0A7W6KJG1_9HYPH|nr:SRPBCC domain-containing protein [Martelella radicis]MBB4121010.1 activator of HSP90 ATPase [Martelella radicis]